MAASWCSKVFSRLTHYSKFVDRCFLSNNSAINARCLGTVYTSFKDSIASSPLNVTKQQRLLAPPTVQLSRSFQTAVYLEKYYVKPNYLKKWGRRDMKRRSMFKDHEMERSSFRLIKKSDILPSVVREKAASDMEKLPMNSSITRVRNRCVLTDRSRGNVGRFRVSRMMFRYFADKGLMAGITRSQW